MNISFKLASSCVSSSMTPLFGTLLFSWLLLLILSLQELTEACSCIQSHPQEQICHSDLVIRAKIRGKTVIEDSPHNFKTIRYEIKQIKMFKGFEKMRDVQYAFTPFESATCGVKLETNKKKQYLLTGQIRNDGRFHINLCGFILPWNNLTLSQKINLNQRYQMGCDCKISACHSVPCSTTSPNECLWTDWLIEKKSYGRQAKYYACIKRSDRSCRWYRSGPHVEKVC